MPQHQEVNEIARVVTTNTDNFVLIDTLSNLNKGKFVCELAQVRDYFLVTNTLVLPKPHWRW